MYNGPLGDHLQDYKDQRMPVMVEIDGKLEDILWFERVNRAGKWIVLLKHGIVLSFGNHSYIL